VSKEPLHKSISQPRYKPGFCVAGVLLNAAANLASTLFAAVPCAVGDILVAAPSHHNTNISYIQISTKPVYDITNNVHAVVADSITCNILSNSQSILQQIRTMQQQIQK